MGKKYIDLQKLRADDMEKVYIQINRELSLRSWEVTHAPQLFSLVDQNRNALSKWLPWVPFVKEEKDSLKFISSSVNEWQKQTGLELGIWQNNILVGCIGLHELDNLHHKTSIGYWLGSEYQGKGIMTKAVNALIDYCFTQHTFNRIEVRAAVDNEKSRAIPLRLGFTEEGILREAEFVYGKYKDNVVYSLLKREWKK